MPTTQEARLDFRLGSDLKDLIEQAAELRGQTVSEFAKAVLIEKAENVLQESRLTRLTLRDSQRFLSLLDRDLRPNKALRMAARSYRKHRRG